MRVKEPEQENGSTNDADPNGTLIKSLQHDAAKSPDSLKSVSHCLVNGKNVDSATEEAPAVVVDASSSVSEPDNTGLLEKYQRQLEEAAKRENVLVMRLTMKEQEVQEYLAQLEELRSSLVSGGHIKNSLLDPAINAIFQRMKAELEQTKEKLTQSEQEFEAWKFTPDSASGKRLMAKCHSLLQENEELGKMISVGRVANLENDLALSRKMCEDLKNSQTDIEAFLLDLDSNMEGLQLTAMTLQRRCDELSKTIVDGNAASTSSRRSRTPINNTRTTLNSLTKNQQQCLEFDLSRVKKSPIDSEDEDDAEITLQLAINKSNRIAQERRKNVVRTSKTTAISDHDVVSLKKKLPAIDVNVKSTRRRSLSASPEIDEQLPTTSKRTTTTTFDESPQKKIKISTDDKNTVATLDENVNLPSTVSNRKRILSESKADSTISKTRDFRQRRPK